MITVSLIVLAVLSYLGKNLGMLASVLAMALALWLTQKRQWPVQATSMLVGSLVATLCGEVIHVAYHRWAASQGIAPPTHGGFWMSATLVGLINVAAMLPAVLGTVWWKRRTARRDS